MEVEVEVDAMGVSWASFFRLDGQRIEGSGK